MQLTGCDVEHGIQLGEEAGDALFRVGNVHALDGQTDDVDGGERKVAPAYRCLGAESVLEHTRAASHGSHFVQVAFGIVGLPVLALVEGGVQVQEVGEEAPGRHLAGQPVEVVVAVFGQVADAAFLFPDLDGEDGRLAVAHSLIGAVQQFADDAASFGRCVGTVVDGAEHHLVATARVDGIHVVDEGFHRLMHARYGLVDGMLYQAFFALQPFERTLQIVVQFLMIEVRIVGTVQLFERLDFFNEAVAHVGGQVEIEGRDGLPAMHFVLGGFQRDAAQDAGRFDSFGRTGFAVSG